MKFKVAPIADLISKQNNEFAGDLAKLISVSICDPKGTKMYNEFFDQYGTHYIDEATFGGIMRLTAEVNYTYYTKMTTKEKFEATLLKQFENLFNGTSHKIDQKFLNHTYFQKSLFGGKHRQATDASNIPAWKDSIAHNRIPVHLYLRPLSDMAGGHHVKRAQSTVWFKYQLGEWHDVMTYLKLNSQKSVFMPGCYDPSKILHRLQIDYINKACPYQDDKWWSVMHVVMNWDAGVALKLRNVTF